jgi:hypothetical protein
MPSVLRFAYWFKNGIKHQNQMKTDIAVKIGTFKVNLLKTVRITYFCHQKWKNSTLIDKNLRTLPVFIRFWSFIPFWNQETKQIIMGEYSSQFNQVRLIP